MGGMGPLKLTVKCPNLKTTNDRVYGPRKVFGSTLAHNTASSMLVTFQLELLSYLNLWMLQECFVKFSE